VVALAVQCLECGRRRQVEFGQQVGAYVEILEQRNVIEGEFGDAVVVDAHFGEPGASGKVDFCNPVAGGVQFGQHGVAAYGEFVDAVAGYIHGGEGRESAEVECAGELFVFPLDFSDIVAHHGNAFPGCGIVQVGDVQCLCVGGGVFGWLVQEVLKLPQLTTVYAGACGCADKCECHE
jgi:hypothetical protein